MQPLGSTMRVFQPYDNLFAFYDGRIEGVRAWSEEPNWLDDGAYALGVCTYAIVDQGQALVYDTHISLDHARIIRKTLEEAGFSAIRVVLSHWHDDHVAGNAVFGDCEILAHALTVKALAEHRSEIESGDPPIKPLVMPTRAYEGSMWVKVGGIDVELRHVDVHSLDETLLWLPGQRLLFAGDALEEPITYVAEPERLAIHLKDLARMAAWDVGRILPNHGAPEVIATGGYETELIGATQRYVEKLLRCRDEPGLAAEDLRTFAAEDFAAGGISYFEPYEAVHRRNVEVVLGAG